MRRGQILRTYKVALGKGNGEVKQRVGDHQTPEGLYVIDAKKSQSRFHLALHISYPNAEDTRRAAKAHISPGGNIEIHGLQNGLGWIGSAEHWVDWTDGCIALPDAKMDEVWKAVPIGTPIEIDHEHKQNAPRGGLAEWGGACEPVIAVIETPPIVTVGATLAIPVVGLATARHTRPDGQTRCPAHE
jgi:murein L,D-transpeptidase YafK